MFDQYHELLDEVANRDDHAASGLCCALEGVISTALAKMANTPNDEI